MAHPYDLFVCRYCPTRHRGCFLLDDPKSAPAPAIVDGPVTFLTTGNLDGDDDDPAVAVDGQGRVHAVWFSDRDGTKDLYAVHSTAFDLVNGTIAWSDPVQITNNDPAQFPNPAQGDNFPTLFIDGNGNHHLAWHRVDLINASHILYMQSDGTAEGWAAATVQNVTSGLHYDRFPKVVKFASNEMRIYFNSSTRATPNKNDIFFSRSTDNGITWEAPVEVASLNTATEQSTFPTIVKAPNGPFLGTLVRWKLQPASDFLDPSSDVFYAVSGDGETWTVEQVTSDSNDIANDLTPTLFFDHASNARLAWATTGFGDPAADIVQMRVSDRSSFPSLVSTLSSSAGTPDHSPEIIPLTVNGQQIYVMIWVRIATPPHNQVVYRLFSGL
jgi:hypothetical protein